MNRNLLKIAKSVGLQHNVCMRVIDVATRTEVQRHVGHNAATQTMLNGIAHYLKGDGVLLQSEAYGQTSLFSQGYEMLGMFVPRYISLGTMGLDNQDEDEFGWPIGISDYKKYMLQVPGFGADGYDVNLNNERPYLGLGPDFKNRPKVVVNGADTYPVINCELVSNSYPRASISFRDVIPEYEAELPQTIDVVFSAMISSAALHEFRPEGKDYIFITEAGLWSERDFNGELGSGLLAGYRIAPPSRKNWYMEEVVDDSGHILVTEAEAAENREILRKNILRVGPNQVVQVIWKVQLGALDQLGGINNLYNTNGNGPLYWDDWVDEVPLPDLDGLYWDDWK